MISPSQVPELIGGSLYDSAGTKVGQTTELLFDDDGTPLWAAVRTGTGSHVVPLSHAHAEGSAITVDLSRSTIEAAPPVRFAEGRLQPEDERALLEHYPAVGAWSSDTPAGGPGEVSVVRSEERLVGGVETVIGRRARVQKYVVTETRTVTVDVRREMARLVYDDAEPGAGSSPADPAVGQSPTPSERVFVLSEEEPVVTLRTVPYAQARLVIEVETEDVPVAADVRIERVTLLNLPSGTLAPRAE